MRGATYRRRVAVDRIWREIYDREMDNLGRWCEIQMRKDSKKYSIIRTGYGPMERPDRDPHIIEDTSGAVVARCDTLWDVANWIYEYR